jgi:hypothetical protein
MTTSTEIALENDDGRRPRRGVVVTLLDMEDGTSRIILDDVTADPGSQKTSWKQDTFYTHKRLNSTALDDMALPASEYQGLGEALLAQLLALNGRVR